MKFGVLNNTAEENSRKESKVSARPNNEIIILCLVLKKVLIPCILDLSIKKVGGNPTDRKFGISQVYN